MYDGDARWQLHGRCSEVEALDEVLRTVHNGRSAVMVIRGEAGIGKTALMDYVAERASACRIVRATGVEAEMELAFAGLHQLCGPLMDRQGSLPDPQRDALTTAFGLSAGSAPDRFLVALAVLTLLSAVADETPLLCLIDDAQWLDRASAQCLAFVARRVLAESMALVFAVREPSTESELSGLPELALKGLGEADARSLLESAIPGRIDGQVRDRILAETRGNPLALLELHRAVTAADLAGGFGFPDARPLATRIEDSFAKRTRTLPADAQLLLLIAAAEPVGDPTLTWAAAELLGIGGQTGAAAQESGLIEFGARVRFRHPLVRSAVYRTASVIDRQRVHSALARATDPTLDPDRRAWHLAQAAPQPDEAVAAELERSAHRAQTRGGAAAAGAFLARSAELTPDPARRGPRALAAATAELQAGAFAAALTLLNATETGPLDELQHARIDLLRGRLAFLLDRGREAPGLLLRAAQRLQPLDIGLSRETFLEALIAAMYAGRLAVDCSPAQVGEAALAVGDGSPSSRPADLLLEGLAVLTTAGRAAAVSKLKDAVDVFRNDAVGVEDTLRWLWLAPAAQIAWDHEAWNVLSERQVQLARETGALGPLSFALSQLATLHVLKGDFAKGAALIDESAGISNTTGVRLPPYGPVLLAALRGREKEANDLMAANDRDLVHRGEGAGLTYLEWARANLYNGLGRYDEALAAARRAMDDRHEFRFSSWVAMELVEAAARSGNREQAITALHRLCDDTSASGGDWALGVEARSRALLADGEAAELLYREAIERLERTPLRVPLARAQLLYGEWLRRENRRVDCRVHLRAAHDHFTSMGMEAFADRARVELLATGETVRKRTVETRDDLTAQERQIAEMARDGLSNPEIGARLFLSPRTVEWHLRKVFGKLGIKYRQELAKALAAFESELEPA